MTAAALLKKKERIKRLTKAVIKHKGNQSEMARELGVTRQTIQKQIHDPAIEKTFIQIMEASGIDDKRLAKVMDEGLSASKYMMFGKKKIEDHQTRHKFLETALKVKKLITGDNAGGQIQVNVAAFLVPEKKALPQ